MLQCSNLANSSVRVQTRAMPKPPRRSGPPHRSSKPGENGKFDLRHDNPPEKPRGPRPGQKFAKRPDKPGFGSPDSRKESFAGKPRNARRPQRIHTVDTTDTIPAPRAHKTGEPQRIAKLLARAGVGSRRDVERMIADGRVTVAGQVLATPALNLTSLADVTLDGQAVSAASATRIFRFHKPPGCLTTARDPKGRATIYDILPKDLPRLVTIGRLDMNTEGLLLLTNDGELKRAMELPANALPRRYRVRVFGPIASRQLESLIEGITVDGVRYGPINAEIERRSGANSWISMMLKEGKNREIRKVLEYLGLQVTRLIRTGYGPFELGDLSVRGVDEIQSDTVRHLKINLKTK